MHSHGTPIRVDHVGIAVDSLSTAEPILFALGCEKTHEEPSPDGTFVWATYELGDASRLELVAPLDGESFLTRFLDRHGSGLHHVTLEVADIDAVVGTLAAAGAPVVDEADRDGWREAYLSPKNPTGALIQLMEYRPGYADSRGGPARAYVGGERLREVADE
ncbi:VOC family protein [Haloferacaceae archaeon DSL9]